MSPLSRPPRRGTVLLLTIFFLTLMFFLALAFTRLLPGDLQAATRERLDTQGSYACDAAIQTAMKVIQAGNTPSAGTTGTLGGDGWSWAISAVDGPVKVGSNRYYWITAEGRLYGTARRRARACLQVAGAPITRFAYFFDLDASGGGGNPDAAWDYNIQCKGDIYWQGMFAVRNFSRSSSPPQAKIQGVVYATKLLDDNANGLPDSPCGAKYNDDKPYDTVSGANVALPAQYNKIYRDGVSGISANANNTVPFDGSQASADVRSGTWGSGGALNSVTGWNSAPADDGVFVNYDSGTNVTKGGVYVKGSVANVTMRVVDANRNVLTQPPGDVALKTGNSEVELQFSSAIKGPVLAGNTTTNTSSTSGKWYVTEVSDGYNFPSGTIKVNGTVQTSGYPAIPTGTKKLVVRNATANEFYVYNSQSNGALYVDGDIGSDRDEYGIAGVNKGSRTIWGSGSVNIRGEVLKSCLPAGAEPTEADTDILGIGKDYTFSASTELNIRCTANPHPGNNTFCLYAAMAGLGKADLETLHGQNGSALWSGATLLINGSLIQDDSTAGHIKKIFDFFQSAGTKMVLDVAAVNSPPPLWPGSGGASKPILRAYVDQVVSY